MAANVSQSGTIVTLTFGGQVNGTNINTFFDGGTDAYGTSGGAANNVGITFTTPAVFENAGYNGSGVNGGTGKFEHVPSGAAGVLYMSGVPTTTTPIMNDASGFSSLSFNYSVINNSSTYAGGTVQLWSGLGGTGTLLDTLTLGTAATTVACSSSHDEFCSWSSASTGALGAVAESAVFLGNARIDTEYDALSLNTAVPLPASAWLMLGGIAGLAGFARSRSRANPALSA
jgi:hypothetical protein